jgi:hypothetical protein
MIGSTRRGLRRHARQHINTANALAIDDTFTAPYVAMTPQAVTFQVAYNGGTSNHLVTAWTTAQNMGPSRSACLPPKRSPPAEAVMLAVRNDKEAAMPDQGAMFRGGSHGD